MIISVTVRNIGDQNLCLLQRNYVNETQLGTWGKETFYNVFIFHFILYLSKLFIWYFIHFMTMMEQWDELKKNLYQEFYLCHQVSNSNFIHHINSHTQYYRQ